MTGTAAGLQRRLDLYDVGTGFMLDVSQQRQATPSEKVVGEQAGDDYKLAPLKHAENLAAMEKALGLNAGPLRRILADSEIVAIAEEYVEYDKQALKWQKSFKNYLFWGLWVAVFAFFLCVGASVTIVEPQTVLVLALAAVGVLLGYFLYWTLERCIAAVRTAKWRRWLRYLMSALGGALAYGLADHFATPDDLLASRAALASIAFLLLVICWLTFFFMNFQKRQSTWYRNRAAAEKRRMQLFNRVIDHPATATADELPVLPLKLEYFRRYQYEVQRSFYRTRSAEHEATRVIYRRVRRFGTMAVVLALFAAIAIVLSALGEQQVNPVQELTLGLGPVTNIIDMANADGYLLLLGVLLGACTAALFVMTRLDNNERNAIRYRSTQLQMDEVVDDKRAGLESTREAAMRGDAAAVKAFVDRLQDIMMAEHKEWISLGDPALPASGSTVAEA